MSYEPPSDPWEVRESDFPENGNVETKARFLLQYAILAPSSHNSQPWEFAIEAETIEVFVDRSRWLEVADPDKRELYFSVGCALENLVIAANHFGFDPTVEYADADEDPLVARVILESGEGIEDSQPLFSAITDRGTNHNVFDDRSIDEAVRERLVGTASAADIDVVLIDDERKAEIARLQTETDEQQFDDPAYRKELGYWIGTGALGSNWLKARIGQLAVTYLDLGASEGEKNSTLIESAPIVGLIATASNDQESRIEAGRAFERLALQATVEGIAIHPMNQILQVPERKAELVDVLDAGDMSPQLLFRVGYAAEDPVQTPRRPVREVLRA